MIVAAAPAADFASGNWTVSEPLLACGSISIDGRAFVLAGAIAVAIAGGAVTATGLLTIGAGAGQPPVTMVVAAHRHTNDDSRLRRMAAC